MYNFKQTIELPTGEDLPPKEVTRLQGMLDEMIERAFFGGYPKPTTLSVGAPQRCCYGNVIHAPNCKTWGVVS